MHLNYNYITMCTKLIAPKSESSCLFLHICQSEALLWLRAIARLTDVRKHPPFLAVKMGAAICKFYGSSFRSHPRPAIFNGTKQLVLLLDIEHLFCLIILFLCIMLIMNTLVCSANSFTVYCTLLFFSLFLYCG